MMAHRVVPHTAEPCLWASAGLLTYKLCDRQFDCEHCPLDAALRGGSLGVSPREGLLGPGSDGRLFPDDRLYTRGHGWVMAIDRNDSSRLRFGLDAFAAAILGRCNQINWQDGKRCFSRGEAICQIDLGLGVLSVGAPVRGKIARGNSALRSDPSLLVTSPYEDGWILELAVENPADLTGLLRSEATVEKARMDLQRFRRRVGMQLLADAGLVGPTLPDGGELVTDLRQMLGGQAYLDLLRELIY